MAKRKKHAKKARLARLAIWVIALAMTMTGVTLPAAAQTPPFEVVFPQDVEATSFIDSWGYPRSGGRRHKGTDLMAPKMTEVYAVGDGVVEKVGTGRLPGRYVRIRHEGGWTSYYMHLNNDLPGSDDGTAPWFITVAPGVFEGAEITAGQLLGWVGDSGNAENTAPHTHFELRRNGVAVNPYPILKRAYDEAVGQREEMRERLAQLVDLQVLTERTGFAYGTLPVAVVE